MVRPATPGPGDSLPPGRYVVVHRADPDHRLAVGDREDDVASSLTRPTRPTPVGRLPAVRITPQRCTWGLAESTQAGRVIMANGVGAYRLGASARSWLAEWQARVG